MFYLRGPTAQQVTEHRYDREEHVAPLQQQTVEHTVLNARAGGKVESSGRFSVEYQGHERFEVEGFAVGENLQRNAVYRAELLHALDQVGQLADLVLAFVRRALGRGGEDAETEDIDEIVVVHASAIDPLFRAAEELRRRLDRVFLHAERSGEVVGRTCRDDAQQQVEVLLLHPIDHVIDRAVAARHDHQIDRFVSIERVAAEIDRAVYDRVAGLPEHFADGLGIFFDFSFSRLGVIEK